MTQLFDDAGLVVPVTVIEAGPCFVTQVKRHETDGYEAIQIGFQETEERKLTRAERGHLGLLKADKAHPSRKQLDEPGLPLRTLREIRVEDAGRYQEGQRLDVGMFSEGELVDVVGTSKGRGFQGVVKRHGFSGGPKTHGQSDRRRAPGSVGAGSTPGRVFKGMRMAGHMGNQRVTQMNLRVVRVDPEQNLLVVRGAVPGSKGGLLLIREARKQKQG